MFNKISTKELANEIFTEANKQLKQLSDKANIAEDKLFDILEKIEEDLKLAMLLGHKDASSSLVQFYTWNIENLGLSEEDKKFAHECYKQISYIGNKLKDNNCLEIIEDFFSEKIEKELNKKVEIIQEIQNNYKNKSFENSDQAKEIICRDYFSVISNDTDRIDIRVIGGSLFILGKEEDVSLIKAVVDLIGDKYWGDTCILL